MLESFRLSLLYYGAHFDENKAFWWILLTNHLVVRYTPKNGLQAPFSYNFATIVSKWLASIGLKKYAPPFFFIRVNSNCYYSLFYFAE
jgi:hypothetical protein